MHAISSHSTYRDGVSVVGKTHHINVLPLVEVISRCKDIDNPLSSSTLGHADSKVIDSELGNFVVIACAFVEKDIDKIRARSIILSEIMMTVLDNLTLTFGCFGFTIEVAFCTGIVCCIIFNGEWAR